MAAPPIEFKDIEDIVKAWKLHNSNYYAIWQSNTLKFANEIDEEAEAEDKLRENLQAIEASNTTAIYNLKVYRDIPITSKKEYKGSFTFRLTNQDIIPGQQLQGGGVYVLNGQQRQMQPALPSALELKLDKLLELQTKQIDLFLASMQPTNEEEEEEEEDEEEEDEEEEETTEQKVERMVAMGAMMADKLTPILSVLIAKIFPNNNQNKPAEMSGTSEKTQDQIFSESVQQITAVLGNDVFVTVMQKLALMAKNEPEKLKGLITYL